MAEQIYRFRDPLSFPRIDKEAVRDAREGVWIEEPAQPSTRLRVPPAFQDVQTPPSILGPLDTRPPVVYSPNFALVRSDVTLTGYRTMLGSDGTFCSDEAFVDAEMQERALARLTLSDEFNNESTGLAAQGGGGFAFRPGDRPCIELSGTNVLLCSTEPSNYGSFLFRILPKLRTLADLDLAEAPVVVPVFFETMADLLRLSGIDDSRIVHHYPNAMYRIERAVMLGLRNAQAYLDDGSLAFFAEMREKHGLPSLGRRLFITRNSLGKVSNAATGRVMTNEAELIDALRAHDFEIVEPSRLTALEQIRLFSSAGLIVGASGSAMFNAVFCHPGTKLIDIESEPHWIHAHTCLFGSLGLDYGIVEAEATDRDPSHVHKPFSVQVEPLIRRILAFEKTRA